MSERLEVGLRSIELGNPDKVLFPDAGIPQTTQSRGRENKTA